MNETNNQINGINHTINHNNENNKKADNRYNNLKKAYHDFVFKISKTDFANSPRRYIIELNFIKELKNLSKEKENKELDTWIEKETDIKQKLSQWGISIGD